MRQIVWSPVYGLRSKDWPATLKPDDLDVFMGPVNWLLARPHLLFLTGFLILKFRFYEFCMEQGNGPMHSKLK